MKHKSNFKLEASIHLLIWLVFLCIPISFSMGSDRGLFSLISFFWPQLFTLAFIFYLNYWFFNSWLFSESTVKKITYFVANFLIIFILITIKMKLGELSHGREMKGPKDDGPPIEFRYYLDFLLFIIPIASSIALTSAKRIRLSNEIKRESENIKLTSELQYLKFQLQPHFFFNSLNNIYFLIDSDAETAKKSIHSLSKLMRHLLHKADFETIDLNDEIEFLKKYIELMSLRYNEKTSIITQFPAHVENVKIAPLLFISLVENAFKHGISATEPSFVYFELELISDQIKFTVKNSKFVKSKDDFSGSGIGLENLIKRLELLYPNQYTYTTNELDNEYHTCLEITLK